MFDWTRDIDVEVPGRVTLRLGGEVFDLTAPEAACISQALREAAAASDAKLDARNGWAPTEMPTIVEGPHLDKTPAEPVTELFGLEPIR